MCEKKETAIYDLTGELIIVGFVSDRGEYIEVEDRKKGITLHLPKSHHLARGVLD